MTLLVNSPSDFAGDALAGFAATQPDRVLPVPGGVVRSRSTTEGQVAVVMGGGSGHFPAFSGWVGPGFGSAAACGNIFASPSENQILSVARSADSGGGVLFVPINYAGDILHFSAAVEKLRLDGVDARMIAVTDDIASASTDDRALRRGIAGSFTVLKIIGAAAEAGQSIDTVERIAIAANEATRSFGVAFSGCTLPGSAEPLFTVPAGRVAVGLGIHGEPGISESELGSADDIADLLVDGLFAERAPEAGRPLAVLVNGLGATKYDELFVVFDRVRARLEAVGMSLVAPVVGEQVTSYDMAGLSLSVTYLDDELERLWLAPADSASFTRGEIAGGQRRTVTTESAPEIDVPPASSESRAAVAWLVAQLKSAEAVLVANESLLGELDAVAGDGDHGAGMVRGVTAAVSAAVDIAAKDAGLGSVLASAGAAWSDRAGGASGALWGAGLTAAGEAIGNETVPGPQILVRAISAFGAAIGARGGAIVGEKTMIDAIDPFAEEFAASIRRGAKPVDAWRDAATRAREAADATAGLIARRGRSRTHGDHSVGTADPGATSFALLVSHLPVE
ncbi:MAG TPA: dihydroxyacetone kinase family protein [Galbitalea sp.]|nr:dihydroxyacetone kinase family protein [Galbitalea sp.]